MDSATLHLERSLNRQIVLEEDEYTAALSRIIARDFFPSLAHLDATNEYLDALHSRDPHLVDASVRRLDQIRGASVASSSRGATYLTPSRTPYGFGPIDTPLRSSNGEGPVKRPRFDTDLRLDAFQARYTSEDNSSFTHILDNENQKRREKWAWAWDAQTRVEGRQDRMIADRERMLIEAPQITGVRERFAIETPTIAGLLANTNPGDGEQVKGGEMRDGNDDTDTSREGKETILFNSKDAEEEDVMAPKKDSRSAGVDGWRFKARNSLMFPPDADESPYHSIDLAGATDDPKVIKYDNTRFTDYDHSSSTPRGPSLPASPTRSHIEAAITGTPYRTRSPTSNRFSLVPNIPSPTATELGSTAVKQLMTWGTLNATPRIISQSDGPANLPPPNTPFHLPTISSREVISHKLSSNASKSLRAKAGLLGLTPGIGSSRAPGSKIRKKGNMAPPSWTPRRLEAAGNLTPAARRLLERSTMGAAAAKRTESMERSARWEGKGKEKDLNRIRWTPTPTPLPR